MTNEENYCFECGEEYEGTHCTNCFPTNEQEDDGCCSSPCCDNCKCNIKQGE